MLNSAIASLRVSRATIAPEAALVCAPYQKHATTARTSAGRLAPEGAERRASENRIRNSGRDAGEANKIHQNENDERADADRHNKIDKIAADEKQARREIVAPQAVNVGGPDVEDAERAPISCRGRGRGPRCRAAETRWRSLSWPTSTDRRDRFSCGVMVRQADDGRQHRDRFVTVTRKLRSEKRAHFCGNIVLVAPPSLTQIGAGRRRERGRANDRGGLRLRHRRGGLGGLGARRPAHRRRPQHGARPRIRRV